MAEIGMDAAISCASLVPTAAQPAVADRLRRLLHGEYLEAASAALHVDPASLTSLVETAGAVATQHEARVHLLLCVAAVNESSSPLHPAVEATALERYLATLAEPLASIELQAAARRLLGTMQPMRRKAA